MTTAVKGFGGLQSYMRLGTINELGINGLIYQ